MTCLEQNISKFLGAFFTDAISESNPRVIDDTRARKLANDLKRCSYYETCATYGLNVERVFQDGRFCQVVVTLIIKMSGIITLARHIDGRNTVNFVLRFLSLYLSVCDGDGLSL